MKTGKIIYGYEPPVELKPHCGLTGCGFECRFAGMKITPTSLSAAYLHRIYYLGETAKPFPALADGSNTLST
jgi:hypothetical protein